MHSKNESKDTIEVEKRKRRIRKAKCDKKDGALSYKQYNEIAPKALKDYQTNFKKATLLYN